MRLVLIAAALVIFAIAPPVAAQQQAPPDTTRAELVRGLGFIRAAETQQLKAIAAHDRRAARVDTVVRVDTLWLPAPVDTVKPAPPPPPADTTPTPPRPADPTPIPASSVALPRAFVDITMPLTTGNLWPVTSAVAFQAALASAKAGDVVELEPGVTYTGSFPLRNRHEGDSTWVVVRTRNFAVPVGQRVTPADATAMARIESAGANQNAIRTELGARGWRLIGVDVSQAPGSIVGALVNINGHDAKTVAEQPSHIILDRVIVRSRPELEVRRCVTMNGAHVAVINSWLGECHAKGADSQAIVAWQGSGPFLIEKNHLEGAGENVMFGGSDSRSPELLPSDITIRENHFYKPPSWKGVWTVKNLLEFKVGRRVLVEGNVFENSWPDGQTGTAIVAKTSNQSGTAAWSETSDVTFRFNLVRNATNGINLAGRPEAHPAVAASRFHIANNAIQSGGRHVLVQGVDSVTLLNNSFADGSHGVLFTGTQRAFVAIGNRWGTTDYGVTADAAGYGSPALVKAAPGATWVSNAMQSGTRNSTIPDGSTIYRAGEALPPGIGATLDVAQLLRRVVGDP